MSQDFRQRETDPNITRMAEMADRLTHLHGEIARELREQPASWPVAQTGKAPVDSDYRHTQGNFIMLVQAFGSIAKRRLPDMAPHGERLLESYGEANKARHQFEEAIDGMHLPAHTQDRLHSLLGETESATNDLAATVQAITNASQRIR